ncbi:hypothetical protein [Streptomonospora salina]|nr:hypothetical protein [Streptomonospora salina]
MESSANGTPRIVELVVRTSENGEFPAQAALNIDFEMLAQALSGIADRSASAGDASGESRPRASVAQESTGRPYRKMPDPDQVTAVFQETGSVGKVAQHCQVPRYTAQSWIDRLRRQGHLDGTKPGASSPRSEN